MSFFGGDVIAKEQLLGAAGSPTIAPAAPTVTVLPPSGFRVPRKPRFTRNVLELFRQYLEMKTRSHEEN